MADRFPAERLDPASYVGPGYDLPVIFGDLDPGHHVNNVALQRYFEQVRYSEHLRADMDKVLHDTGGGLYVVHIGVDFLSETKFGIPLHVRTRISRWGRSSFTEQQAAWQNGRCVAIGEFVQAFTMKDGASAELPEALREAVEVIYGPMPVPV